MIGNKEAIFNNVKAHPIFQMINDSKRVTVTFRMKNGLVFVANNTTGTLPLSCYINLDDIQNKVDLNGALECCDKAIKEGGWKFKFFKEDI